MKLIFHLEVLRYKPAILYRRNKFDVADSFNSLISRTFPAFHYTDIFYSSRGRRTALILIQGKILGWDKSPRYGIPAAARIGAGG